MCVECQIHIPLPVGYCGVGLNYMNAYHYDVRKVGYDFC